MDDRGSPSFLFANLFDECLIIAPQFALKLLEFADLLNDFCIQFRFVHVQSENDPGEA